MVAPMLVALLATVALVSETPTPVSTDPVPTIMKSDRERVHIPAPELNFGDYALTAGLAMTAIGADLWMTPPATATWGGSGVDDSSRDFFRLDSDGARATAGTVSDVLVYGLLSFPLIDAGTMAARGHTGDAARMLVMDMQALFMTESVVNVTKNLAGRERPFVRDCVDGDPDCDDPDARKSFVSGHTARAFTAAGLICTHHGELDLWGGGASDTVACAVATTAAGTVGILRMMADRHYATDVLGGAAVGVFSGFILPRILHYGFGDDDENEARVRLTPMVSTDFAGASASGTF